MPNPCSGPVVSRVFKTIRSSVPCKTSDFPSGIFPPMGNPEEFRRMTCGLSNRSLEGNEGPPLSSCCLVRLAASGDECSREAPVGWVVNELPKLPKLPKASQFAKDYPKRRSLVCAQASALRVHRPL